MISADDIFNIWIEHAHETALITAVKHYRKLYHKTLAELNANIKLKEDIAVMSAEPTDSHYEENEEPPIVVEDDETALDLLVEDLPPM